MGKNPQKPVCYLICVYNNQQGLDTSLASIFEDSLLADIVIVDDGSKDVILQPQAPDDITIHLIRHDENQGLIAALNTGLRYILEKEYTYIARLDAGDTVNKGRLSAQLAYMEEHPDIGLLGTGVRAFDTITGNTLFDFNNPSEPKKVSQVLKMKNCIAHPSVMIRSEVFKTCGFYDAGYTYAEDYELWRRIDRRFGVANLPDIYLNKEISPVQLTAMNRHGSSLSRLKAQIKYFNILSLWCWAGVMRTIIALMIPRDLLIDLRIRSYKS